MVQNKFFVFLHTYFIEKNTKIQKKILTPSFEKTPSDVGLKYVYFIKTQNLIKKFFWNFFIYL